ncbi:Pentatricopeptide repeat-containing protein At5g40400 [Linum perenne]
MNLGHIPTTRNYCLILHILAWSKEFKPAMKLLTELIRSVKDSSSGEDVFQSLVLHSEDCNWDPVVFNMLIKAYVKVGGVKEGFITYFKVIEFGYVPTDGDVSKVNEFLEKMEEEGFEPDIVTYNTLISSYCRKGRFADAYYLYMIMYRRGVLPDLVSYTALKSGLCKEGKMKEALQFFHRMLERLDASISWDVYDYLIIRLCEDDKPFAAKSLLERTCENGYEPDMLTYEKLIESLSKANSLVDALLLKSEIIHRNRKPSVVTYKALIAGLCRTGRSAKAEMLMDEMVESGIVPGQEICWVLPTSAHTVKSGASNFLLNWLFQHEHEHRQWSAAMSLGLITTGLHVTNHKKNFENINGLLEVLCKSRSTLVKGACGVSLGFSCEDLLTRVDDSVNKEKEHYKLQVVGLISRIISTLFEQKYSSFLPIAGTAICGSFVCQCASTERVYEWVLTRVRRKMSFLVEYNAINLCMFERSPAIGEAASACQHDYQGLKTNEFGN